MISLVKIDGIQYDTTVAAIEEVGNIIEGANTGTALFREREIRDIKGIKIGHNITFAPTNDADAFDGLYDYLFGTIRESVIIEVVHNQQTITYEAAYSTYTRRVETIDDRTDMVGWSDMTIAFRPMECQNTEYQSSEVSLFDLASDTVTAQTLSEGITAHDSTGKQITGTLISGDIHSISVSTLPTPNAGILGNIYKYTGEYYACVLAGTYNIYAGKDINFILTFPTAENLYNNFGAMQDQELFKIGQSDSDYITAYITIVTPSNTVLTIGESSMYLNEFSTTDIDLNQYSDYGSQIVEVTPLGDNMLNDLAYKMANITTGRIQM